MATPKDIIRIYEGWKGGRATFLNEAEDVARMTLPQLRPKGNRISEIPFTQLGAMAIRSLGATLHQVLFPAQVKWLRLGIDTPLLIELQEQLAQLDDAQRGQIVSGIMDELGNGENVVLNHIAKLRTRSRIASALRRNLVEGSTACHLSQNRFRFFPLRNFVVFRVAGDVEHLLTREEIASPTEDLASAAELGRSDDNRNWLYTYVNYEEGTVFQQTETKKDGRGQVEEVDSNPAEWFVFSGEIPDVEHYPYGYASDNRSLFAELNHLSQSLSEAAAAAGWNLVVLSPGSNLTPNDIQNRRSGEVLVANADDLTWFTSGIKISDWGFVTAHRAQLAEELAKAFAQGIKDRVIGDRATATEIIQIAQELQSQTSDLLSSYEETLQKPLVKAIMAANEITEISPDGSDPITVMVTTGQNALNREAAISRMLEFLGVAKQLDPTMLVDGVELMKRGGNALQFDSEGVVSRAQQPEAGPAGGQEGPPVPEQQLAPAQ